jgi:adenine/guanine phosphoribosyltransferase-like PRPP-binding protein
VWIGTGVMFQDITTLLLDPQAFKDSIDLFVERYKGKGITVVAGQKMLLYQLCFYTLDHGYWLY